MHLAMEVTSYNLYHWKVSLKISLIDQRFDKTCSTYLAIIFSILQDIGTHTFITQIVHNLVVITLFIKYPLVIAKYKLGFWTSWMCFFLIQNCETRTMQGHCLLLFGNDSTHKNLLHLCITFAHWVQTICEQKAFRTLNL
jgi:hypothetical protein